MSAILKIAIVHNCKANEYKRELIKNDYSFEASAYSETLTMFMVRVPATEIKPFTELCIKLQAINLN